MFKFLAASFLNKKGFETLTSVVSKPVEIEVHTVPHFQAPVNCKVGYKGLEDPGIFT